MGDYVMSSIGVSLHLWGVNLEPEIVTKTLNINPTRSQKAGNTQESVSGKRRTARSGMWELASSDNVVSTSLCDHLAWMVQQLGKAPVSPTALETVEEARIDIVITGGDDEVSTIEFDMDSSVLSQLSSLALPLHFTVYWALHIFSRPKTPAAAGVSIRSSCHGFDQFNILLEQAVGQFRQGDALGISTGAEVVLNFCVQIHRLFEIRVRVKNDGGCSHIPTCPGAERAILRHLTWAVGHKPRWADFAREAVSAELLMLLPYRLTTG